MTEEEDYDRCLRAALELVTAAITSYGQVDRTSPILTDISTDPKLAIGTLPILVGMYAGAIVAIAHMTDGDPLALWQKQAARLMATYLADRDPGLDLT